MAYAGIEVDKPAAFLMRPDPDKVRQMLAKFAQDPANIEPWHTVEHPQLGEVEVGGLEYLRTIRNPPVSQLGEECLKVFEMAERARRALPEVRSFLSVMPLDGDAYHVRLVLENVGFLSTSGLSHGAAIGASPGVSAHLHLDEGMTTDDILECQLDHLDGWGNLRTGAARHPVYAGLPGRGHRQFVEWVVRGEGDIEVHWRAGRAGRGEEYATLG